jgi:hypothetical protein
VGALLALVLLVLQLRQNHLLSALNQKLLPLFPLLFQVLPALLVHQELQLKSLLL